MSGRVDMATDWRGYDATHADADDPYTAAARSYEGIGVGLQSEFEQLSIDQHTLVNDLLSKIQKTMSIVI